MKLSAFGYLFNASLREFDLDGMVKNFTDFFDETVIATILSKDNTYERLLAYQKQFGVDRFRVIMSNIDITKTNRWDGELKTIALQGCSKSTPEDPRCYVIMDGDERIPLSHREYWNIMAKTIINSQMDGLLIPVIDLYGTEKHIRADIPTGFKFRIHKNTVVKRGVLPQAELENGLFRTDMSDSTEPLLENGQLAQFGQVYSYGPCYVLHYGHLDQQRRAKLNREFWREHWKNRDGKEPNMTLDPVNLEKVQLIEHGLDLA